MFKNRKILGRRCAWGVTACFEQTQQIKAANRNLLGRRSFFGGLVGTRGRRGATVPPYSHNVKKQVEQKRSIPEVKELTCIKCFYVQFKIPEMEFQRKI